MLFLCLFDNCKNICILAEVLIKAATMTETIINRKESYIETIKALPESQRRVYFALDEIAPASNREISIHLRLPVNCITGRCKELRENNHVIECGTKYDEITKRNVTLFKPNYNLFNQPK